MGVEESILLNLVSSRYTIVIEYDASNNPVYVGEAKTGTAKSASGWRIKKITYDVSNNPTDIMWAESSSQFDKIWANRASYKYG